MKLAQAVGVTVACTVVGTVIIFTFCIFVIAKCCVVRLRSDQSEFHMRDLELALARKDASAIIEVDEVSQEDSSLDEAHFGLAVLDFDRIEDQIEVESFDRQTNGLGDNESRYERMNLTGRRVDRLSAIKLVNYCGCRISTLNRIEKNLRGVFAHYFSLYDRSLVVQNMAQEILNGSKAITEIKDQHSPGIISVGSIVMVKTRFTGNTRDLEFESLEPGQMLKVVKFFVKNQVMDTGDFRASVDQQYQRTSDLSYRAALDKQISTEKDLKEAGLISPCPTIEPEVLEQDDPNYPHIWCSGSLYRSCLHHDKTTGTVLLSYSAGDSSKYQVVRDFPLSCVTLESSIPKHEPRASGILQSHEPSDADDPDELYVSSEETVADVCESPRGDDRKT